MKFKLGYLVHAGTNYIKISDVLNILKEAHKRGKGQSEIIKEIERVDKEITFNED